MSDDREKQNKKTLQTSKNGLQRCFLASLGRFELPAFRLGGERSILLSYRDVYQIYSIFPLKRIRTSCRLGGVCSIQLSYGDIFNLLWSRMEQLASQDFDDLIIRRAVLYPTELLAHIKF